MAVEVLNDKKQWDAFVEASPQGMLFHRWDFLKIVERHSGYRLLPYGIYSGDELLCLFPFFLGRERGLTLMDSPPPNTQIPHLGPAFAPSMQALKTSTREKNLDHVTGELFREIDKIAPNYVSITTVPNLLDVRPFIWKNYKERLRFTYVIDLERTLDEIWASFSRHCRQKIKHVSKQSPEVQQTRDVRPMLKVWRERFAEQRILVPLISDQYLEELMAAFPQEMTVYSLILDGEFATAEACCAMQNDRYAVWIGGTSVRKDTGVNEYLDWEVIQRAKAAGFTKLDLGVWDVGFSLYKAKFDPILEPFLTLKNTDTLYKIYYLYKKLRGLQS